MEFILEQMAGIMPVPLVKNTYAHKTIQTARDPYCLKKCTRMSHMRQSLHLPNKM